MLLITARTALRIQGNQPIVSLCFHRSVLSGVTSLEDLEAVAAPFKTATKTLAARAAEAGLEAAAMDILGGSKVISLDSLVDVTVSLKRCFALINATGL